MASSLATQSNPLLSLPAFSSTSSSRLHSLYSDFSRQKQSNPASYSSNVEWWRQTLTQLVSTTPLSSSVADKGQGRNRLILVAGQSLVDGLKLPGAGKPLGLGAVITELRHSKSLIPISDFLSLRGSIYDPAWLPTRIVSFIVGKPLWWALEQLGLSSDGTGAGSSTSNTAWWGEYVLVQVVEKGADRVMELLREKALGPADMLFDLQGFRRTFGRVVNEDDTEDILLTEKDAKVLLKYLERDRKVLVVEKNVVIKFVDENAAEEVRRVTAVDRGILELKTAIANLKAQVNETQRRIDECTQKAASALQQKHKSVAMSHLRSRKLYSDLLEKRIGSLQTLEATMHSVETAAGDIEIVKLYESSTTTLRMLLNHPTLQRENINSTMDALAEANADAREVNELIVHGAGDDVDEDELAQELAELEKEERALEEMQRLQNTSAPSNVPLSVIDKGEEEKVALEQA